MKTNTKAKTGEPKKEDAVLADDAEGSIGNRVEDFEGVEGWIGAEAEVAFLHFDEAEAFKIFNAITNEELASVGG